MEWGNFDMQRQHGSLEVKAVNFSDVEEQKFQRV